LVIGAVSARLYLPITSLTPLYAAVLIATFFSGWRVGVFTAVLGFLANWYYFSGPAFSWMLAPWAIANLAIYIVFCALLIVSLSALNEALTRLDRQRKRLRLAMEVAKLGAWRWTPPDTLEWDSSARAMLGLRPEDDFPTMEEFISWVHPNDRAYFDEAVARTRKDNIVPEQEYRVITPDGQTRWLQGRGRVVTDATGAPVRFVGTSQDITDRKRVDELRENILATVSHELRTPLTSIVGFALTLKGKGAELAEDARNEIVAHLAGRNPRPARYQWNVRAFIIEELFASGVADAVICHEDHQRLVENSFAFQSRDHFTHVLVSKAD